MPLRKLTLVGCGLIGGSLGAAVRTAGFTGRVIGCDRPEVLDKALRLGAIDEAAPSLESGLADADVVVLATPISAILSLLPVAARHAPGSALITDTGSTKAEIARVAQTLWGSTAGERCLPGHPISGKERSGVEQADPYLFRGSRWVFTPIAENSSASNAGTPCLSVRQQEWIEIIGRIGAEPLWMRPEEHDHALAFTSHLPQLLSTALANTVLTERRTDSAPYWPHGGGLRDMTRLAKSDPLVWRDILASNRANIRRALDELRQQIDVMDSALAEERYEKICEAFRAGSEIAKLS